MIFKVRCALVFCDSLFILANRHSIVKSFFEIFLMMISNAEGGVRTHVPLRTNGFQDRLVMTTSIPLHIQNITVLCGSATFCVLYICNVPVRVATKVTTADKTIYYRKNLNLSRFILKIVNSHLNFNLSYQFVIKQGEFALFIKIFLRIIIATRKYRMAIFYRPLFECVGFIPLSAAREFLV